MASLDRAKDAVVVRIVYDGPPTSGKTTSLKALAERFGQAQVYTPEELAGRTLYFDWMEYTGGRFEGRPIRCQIVSAPGQRELNARRTLLLDSADAVVFVADTTRARMPVSLSHLDDLMGRLKAVNGPPVGVVLQANKRDVADAEPLQPLRQQHGLAIIESVASTGEGVREAFVFAVRLALDRVRELMRRGELHDATPEHDPAGRLLEQLKKVPLQASVPTMWPETSPLPKAVAPPPPAPSIAAAVVAVAPPVPRATPAWRAIPPLPDVTIPAGTIWPPVHGRVLLQEASSGTLGPVRELAPGAFLADGAQGWRFYSSSACVYRDLEEGRSALIRWAQFHVAASQWISPARCIALCDAPDGTVRLWQVVHSEKTLWSALSDAVASKDARRIRDATEVCERAAQRWAQGPESLPCTLETLSYSETAGTVFVGFMPEPSLKRSVEPTDRRAKLRSQVDTLVATTAT